MAYKSILSFAGADPVPATCIKTAAELARRFDGHLTVAAYGFEPEVMAYGYGEAAGNFLTELAKQARAHADQRAAAAQALITEAGVRGDATAATVRFGNLPRVFGAAARYADLVVLDQPYGTGEDREHVAVDALEGALFDGDAPVLVLPKEMEAGALSDVETVLIGWNGSREALRAVRRAMPFLIAAKKIEIAVIDPPRDEVNPGDALAVMLARQGCTVEVSVQPKTLEPVSGAIAQRLREVGAQMMVMGAYGHSRFREYVLGGVTRDLLQAVPAPLFMAH